MEIVSYVIIGFVVSLLAGSFIGRCIRVGMGNGQESESERKGSL